MSELTTTHVRPARRKGQFEPGNKLGRGNPLAGRVAKIRGILLQRLTPEDAREIADALIRQAKGGDLAAIRELLDRTVGKPTVAVEISGPDGSAVAVDARVTDLAS